MKQSSLRVLCQLCAGAENSGICRQVTHGVLKEMISLKGGLVMSVCPRAWHRQVCVVMMICYWYKKYFTQLPGRPLPQYLLVQGHWNLCWHWVCPAVSLCFQTSHSSSPLFPKPLAEEIIYFSAEPQWGKKIYIYIESKPQKSVGGHFSASKGRKCFFGERF